MFILFFFLYRDDSDDDRAVYCSFQKQTSYTFRGYVLFHHSGGYRWEVTAGPGSREGQQEENEEEEGLFKANAVNEEDFERDRATLV